MGLTIALYNDLDLDGHGSDPRQLKASGDELPRNGLKPYLFEYKIRF